MIGQSCVEAGKYNVLPVDGRGTARWAEERPQIAKDRISYTFKPHTQSVPFNARPRLLNRTHTITADAEIPKVARRVLWSPLAERTAASLFT